MRLSELEQYPDIVIQAHDNPDPDAIASAFGLYVYFTSKGKNARIVYSGRSKIQKTNVVLLVESCSIPIEFVEPETDFGDVLLITVDCQYGEGNVSKCTAKNVAIIDHHQGTGIADYRDVRPYLGSCSTLVWYLMVKEEFDFKENTLLCTALYYGLMTDTGNFMEVSHPLDRDMMDSLDYSKNLVKLFSNSNITLNELEIAGQALIHYEYDEEDKYLIIYSKPCDPNILGLINDIALQVDQVLVSVVYNEFNRGFKLSVRSCTKEVKANELAGYLTEDIGSGGGHIDKAGGYIDGDQFEKKYRGEDIEEYFRERLKRYFKSCSIIYTKDTQISLEGMKVYYKKHIKRGFVDLSEILPEGTAITVRTLEGDIDIKVDKDFYKMIEIKGEVWPIKKEKFLKTYEVLDEKYEFQGEYEPAVHLRNEGKTLNLISSAKSCINVDTSCILARELNKIVKIFTTWDEEKYYYGKPGDFIACVPDNTKDAYVIERDVFFKTYESREEAEA